MTVDRLGIARAAERFVEERLRMEGFFVLARNFRVRGSEIDLVVLKGRVLHGVEVKYRRELTCSKTALYSELFSKVKIERIAKGLDEFSRRLGVSSLMKQIDGVVVTKRRGNFLILLRIPKLI